MKTGEFEDNEPNLMAASVPVLADIAGTWHLVSLSNSNADGSVTEPLGSAPIGRLIYAEGGVMAAQLGASQRKKIGADLSDLLIFRRLGRAPWLLFHAWRKLGALGRFMLIGTQYLAYSGRFSIANGVVRHQVEISTVPDWEGTVLEREASFDAEGHLILVARAGLDVQRLVWRKFSP